MFILLTQCVRMSILCNINVADETSVASEIGRSCAMTPPTSAHFFSSSTDMLTVRVSTPTKWFNAESQEFERGMRTETPIQRRGFDVRTLREEQIVDTPSTLDIFPA
jgi:hypothetical protein